MSNVLKWPIVRLSELAEKKKNAIVGGPFGSNLVTGDYVPDGVPVVRGVNLPKDERFSCDNFVFVTENKADSLKQNMAEPGDLVFTQRGTLGQVGIIPSDTGYCRFLISQSQMKMSVDSAKADSAYLYYYFRMPSTVSYIENHALQSGVPHINLGILKKFEVVCPPPPIQRKIAAILSAYDELIENNKRRIALLEKMAEEIYREWFVRFRFPGYQYAEFVKGIPKGWSYGKLSNLCLVIKRGISPKYDDKSDRLVINQKCIRDGRIDITHARKHNTNTAKEKMIRFSDALINSTGVGTLGRVSVVEFKPEGLTVDSHVTICRANPKKINPSYLAVTVSQLHQYFEFMSSGSTGQTELGQALIACIKILVPDDDLQEKFSEYISNIWAQKQNLFSENEILVKTRDMLLPRLISGKLNVENLDIQFPPSMQGETAA